MNNGKQKAGSEKDMIKNLGCFVKEYWKDYVMLLSISTIIILLDQWTKNLVRQNIPLGGDWLPKGLEWLQPYARIRYWYNSGAAFGFFQNGNLIFMILAVIVICLIIYYFPRISRKDWWLRIAMILQISGAAGNLIDRIQFSHVTDFISVGTFAIFNFADASISVGSVILVLGVWIKERSDKKKAALQNSSNEKMDE
jgi:signal peptidase II